jgi:predicted amidohydrolase
MNRPETNASNGSRREPKAADRQRIAAARQAHRRVPVDCSIAQAQRRVDEILTELVLLVHAAGEAGCDALALSEDTIGIFQWAAAHFDVMPEFSPPAAERMLQTLGEAAARHGMYLVCCTDVWLGDGVYNTAFFLGRDGKEIGRYKKVHHPLPDFVKRAGAGFPVYPTPDLGGVGMLICYDMVFPEAARCLAMGGANIVFNPVLSGGAATSHSEGISRAAYRVRAADNYLYVVVAERGAPAMVIAPGGEVLAETNTPDTFAIADIDPFGGREGGDAYVWQSDMRARLFRERQPGAYAILTDPNPPALDLIPETVPVAEAVAIGQRVITCGNERFAEAEALLAAGDLDGATQAFKRLREEFKHSWVDRASAQRLSAIRERTEQRP